MKKEIVFIVEETDEISRLRNLNYDLETMMAVTNMLFTNHKDDVDNSVFESVPYKKYAQDLQKIYIEFDAAKESFGETTIRPIVEEKTGEKNISFDWNLNFQTLEVTVTMS